jgi:hypothetical protein
VTRRLLPLFLLLSASSVPAIDQLSLSTALKVAQAQNFTLAKQRNSFEQDRLRFRLGLRELLLDLHDGADPPKRRVEFRV